jgi:hypothetical protein
MIEIFGVAVDILKQFTATGGFHEQAASYCALPQNGESPSGYDLSDELERCTRLDEPTARIDQSPLANVIFPRLCSGIGTRLGEWLTSAPTALRNTSF